MVSLKEQMAAMDPEIIGGDLLPAGEQNLLLQKAEAGQTAKGKDKITCYYRVIDGKYKGRVIEEMMVWSPESEKATPMFLRTLYRLGATKAWLDEYDPTWAQIATKITGTRIVGNVSVDEAYGSNRVRVKTVIELGAAAKKTGPPTAGAAPSAAAQAGAAKKPDEAEDDLGADDTAPAASETADWDADV